MSRLLAAPVSFALILIVLWCLATFLDAFATRTVAINGRTLRFARYARCTAPLAIEQHAQRTHCLARHTERFVGERREASAHLCEPYMRVRSESLCALSVRMV